MSSVSQSPKSISRMYFGEVKFPKLEDCAHFHYENVELGRIQLTFYAADSKEKSSNKHNSLSTYRPPYFGLNDNKDFFFTLVVSSADESWLIRRTYTQLQHFDKQLHQCAWDRHVSRIPQLPSSLELSQVRGVDAYKKVVSSYVEGFTALCSPTGSLNRGISKSKSKANSSQGSVAVRLINCGPVLNWLELDNRGNRLIPYCELSEVNTPAIGAAHVVSLYDAQAKDELQLEVGDIISIIDMPPVTNSTWWKGKRGLEVGYFPSDCVEVISCGAQQIPIDSYASRTSTLESKISTGKPSSALPSVPKNRNSGKVEVMSLPKARQLHQPPVLQSRNKISAFLHNFLANRPPRRYLRETGILKQRVFGCDLGEHLEGETSPHRIVPLIVESCCQFVEEHCVESLGVYRLSGIQSNIQKLRSEFDNPDYSSSSHSSDRDALVSMGESGIGSTLKSAGAFLNREEFLKDCHCVPAVLKQYFRELPNPLLTFTLYDRFLQISRLEGEANKLKELIETVHLLPPPHFRTLKFLLRHLYKISTIPDTNMSPHTLAIVWAPNLLRRPEDGSIDRIPPAPSSAETRSGGLNSHFAGLNASLFAVKEINEATLIIELLIRCFHAVFGSEEGVDTLERQASVNAFNNPSFRISFRRSATANIPSSQCSTPGPNQLEFSTPPESPNTPFIAAQGKVGGGAKLISISEAQKIQKDEGKGKKTRNKKDKKEKIKPPGKKQVKKKAKAGGNEKPNGKESKSIELPDVTEGRNTFDEYSSLIPYADTPSGEVSIYDRFPDPPPHFNENRRYSEQIYSNLSDFRGGKAKETPTRHSHYANIPDAVTMDNFQRLRSQSDEPKMTCLDEESEEKDVVIEMRGNSKRYETPVYANVGDFIAGSTASFPRVHTRRAPPPPPLNISDNNLNSDQIPDLGLSNMVINDLKNSFPLRLKNNSKWKSVESLKVSEEGKQGIALEYPVRQSGDREQQMSTFGSKSSTPTASASTYKFEPDEVYQNCKPIKPLQRARSVKAPENSAGGAQKLERELRNERAASLIADLKNVFEPLATG